MSVCLHSRFALRATLRLGVMLRLLCWHGDQLLLASGIDGPPSDCSESQSTLSPVLGGSAAGHSELFDSVWQFLSSATQEDFGSSAAPAGNA